MDNSINYVCTDIRLKYWKEKKKTIVSAFFKRIDSCHA